MGHEKRIVSNGEMMEYFNSMPLVSYARSLLRWIDTGKEVTASGVLRLKDVPSAANCVGLAVEASGQATNPVEELPGFASLLTEEQSTEPLDQDDVVHVRTMLHVPRLMSIWTSLEDSELIDISTTRVKLGEAVPAFLATTHNDNHDDPLTEIQAFIVHYLLRYLTADSNPFEFAAQQVMLSWLAHAVTTQPVTVDPLVDDIEDDSNEIDLDKLVQKIAHGRMTELESFGLVHIDTHYHVPASLVECVAVALSELQASHLDPFGFEQDGGADLDLLSWPTEPDDRDIVLPEFNDGRVLQLKISLKHAKPPIWRRLLVPVSMTLDRLHLVIQTAFGWEHAHLHDFAHRNGLRMIDTSMMEGDEGLLEEATVSIGQLLIRPKDKLTYTYDFGDNWVHTILLEKTLEADAVNDADLPRCTGGRGAAPMEDSGGVWGWMDLVAGANDPTHEHYTDYREWLDLAEGETFDPTSFSKADINAYLSALL